MAVTLCCERSYHIAADVLKTAQSLGVAIKTKVGGVGTCPF